MVNPKDKELIKKVLELKIKKQEKKKFFIAFSVLLLIAFALIFFSFFQSMQQTQTVKQENQLIQKPLASEVLQNQKINENQTIDFLCNNNKKDSIEAGIDCGGVCPKKC
jgi:Na+/melibiose symporter-like transporter